MINFIKNKKTLAEILESEDYANKKIHVYAAGYSAKFMYADKNGNPITAGSDICHFFTDDVASGEETVFLRFFDKINDEEHKSNNPEDIKTDKKTGTITVYKSGAVLKRMTDFWCSSELNKDMAEELVNKYSI